MYPAVSRCCSTDLEPYPKTVILITPHKYHACVCLLLKNITYQIHPFSVKNFTFELRCMSRYFGWFVL